MTQTVKAQLTNYTKIIKPQTKQLNFLSSTADITIYGGAAGAGKSFALLMECARHINNPEFRGIIFRRTAPEIRNPGGLLDESRKLYGLIRGAKLNESELVWKFPSGAQIKLASMQYKKDMYDYQGSQFDLLCIDEATHFEMDEVFYLMSRNRSTSGIRPYCRMTCNPDPDSWLAVFLKWWIDPDTGLPVPARAGQIRYFVRDGDDLYWSGKVKDFKAKFPKIQPKSATFIPALVYDNEVLMAHNPEYVSNLQTLPMFERERLLNGSWKDNKNAGMIFKREWWKYTNATPSDIVIRVRAWDKAGTDNGGDYTVGTLIAKGKDGKFYIEDVIRGQWSAHERELVIQNTASKDGPNVHIVMEQEPGSSGKDSVQHSISGLAGYKVNAVPSTGSKLKRAEPLSAQVEAGNVYLINGEWNKTFVDEFYRFPEGKHDDQVDSASLSFNQIAQRKGFFILG